MTEETNQLRIRLVTPERTLFEAAATAVELPSKSGDMEVLYGHAPLMAELGAGDVRIHRGVGLEQHSPDTTRYNVSWGFVEVLPDRVTILASDALKPEEIDVARAEAAKVRAEKRLASNDANIDWDRATVALQRAVIRIQVARKYRGVPVETH